MQLHRDSVCLVQLITLQLALLQVLEEVLQGLELFFGVRNGSFEEQAFSSAKNHSAYSCLRGLLLGTKRYTLDGGIISFGILNQLSYSSMYLMLPAIVKGLICVRY